MDEPRARLPVGERVVWAEHGEWVVAKDDGRLAEIWRPIGGGRSEQRGVVHSVELRRQSDAKRAA